MNTVRVASSFYNGEKDYIEMSLDSIIEEMTLSPNKAKYEVLNPNRTHWIKPYFDIDDKKCRVTIDTLYDNTIHFLNTIFGVENNDWAVSDDSRKSKSSFHLTLPCFKTTIHDMIRLKEHYKDKFKQYNIDTSVYSNGDQKMRIINFKHETDKQSNGLEPFTFTYSPETHKHIISIVEDNAKVFEFDSNIQDEVQDETKDEDTKDEVEVEETKDEVEYETKDDTKDDTKDEVQDETKEDNLSVLCNNIFKTDCKWVATKNKNNSYILQHSSKKCLIKSKHKHSQKNHSCAFINKNGKSIINCHAHGSKNIKSNKHLTKLKKHLGLVKDKNDMNDFETLCDFMIKYAIKNKLRRHNGFVMKQNTNIPIMYSNWLEYKDFLNLIFSNKNEETYFRLFRKTPTNIIKLVKYLEDIQHPDFPFLKINKYVFAFNNGYLDISDLYDITFCKYNVNNIVATTIHYDIDFNENWLSDHEFETPIFDKICMHHFEHSCNDEVQDEKADDHDSDENEPQINDPKIIYNCFLCMVGRLHYPIHKYDKFNCVLFEKGDSNTGKSTIGNAIMSSHQNVGTISAKMEDTFGLEGLIKKNTIYVQECPKNIHTKLDKTDFQRMIEGSKISVSRKGLTAISDFQWKIPMLWIGNFLPRYIDTSGAIARRICVFYFDNPINHKQQDTSLEQKCIQQEGHLILLKSLVMYKWLIKYFKNKTFQNWKEKIPYFARAEDELRGNVSPLYSFLNISYGNFEYWYIHSDNDKDVVKVEGRDGFLSKFNRWCYLNKYPKIKKATNLDKTILKNRGYILKKDRICNACGKKPTGKRKKEDKCCPEYSNNNRGYDWFITNIKLVTKCDINNDSDSDVSLEED